MHPPKRHAHARWVLPRLPPRTHTGVCTSRAARCASWALCPSLRNSSRMGAGGSRWELVGAQSDFAEPRSEEAGARVAPQHVGIAAVEHHVLDVVPEPAVIALGIAHRREGVADLERRAERPAAVARYHRPYGVR